MQKVVNFSDEAKALCLVKILYEKGIINDETYQAVIEKYDKEECNDDNERKL